MCSFAFARSLAEALEALGVPRAALLEDLPLSEAELTSSARTQPLAQLDLLVERAIALTGDSALGLRWWERAGFGAFGAVGHALSVARDFRAGIELIARYWPLFCTHPLLAIRDEPGLCRVALTRYSRSEIAHRLYMEAAAFALSRQLRQCAGIGGVPRHIAFDFPAPAHASLYATIFRCPIEFDAKLTVFTLDETHARKPQLNHSPELEARLREYADLLLAQQDQDALSTRVLHVLRTGPDAHRMTMEEVAAQLGTSGRTLRRRLQAEGTPFPLLVRRVQREQAEAMLLDPTRSVKQVAYALGFADPSAFHRAVRRWTGKSPGKLRSGSSAPPPPKSAR
jgi:AraC-like DNA-binding protein